MAHFPKPDAGSWTENYPELGTAPVDYTDSIDPAFFEAERDAVFKRTWLNVGRVERLPRTGSYFTKELPSAGKGMSVIIVKTKDGSVKAYHNVCRHRGNKLVWNDFPHEETSGTCRQFTCKYHAWRYSLDGDLTFIQQEDEFFDVDKSQYGLVGVRCEVWEGFIFINFDQNAKPLADYLGPLAKGTRVDRPAEFDQPIPFAAQMERRDSTQGHGQQLRGKMGCQFPVLFNGFRSQFLFRMLAEEFLK